jgi:hypothetical protein
MKALNLPTYSFKIKQKNGLSYIFDPFRRKFVKLNPEEWVRLNFAMFLVSERSFPGSRIAVEKSLSYNRMTKRCDIVVYGIDGEPQFIVECKAPEVALSGKVFDQAAIYNRHFRVQYLAITNGMEHSCCQINLDTGETLFLKDIPDYTNL